MSSAKSRLSWRNGGSRSFRLRRILSHIRFPWQHRKLSDAPDIPYTKANPIGVPPEIIHKIPLEEPGQTTELITQSQGGTAYSHLPHLVGSDDGQTARANLDETFVNAITLNSESDHVEYLPIESPAVFKFAKRDGKSRYSCIPRLERQRLSVPKDIKCCLVVELCDGGQHISSDDYEYNAPLDFNWHEVDQVKEYQDKAEKFILAELCGETSGKASYLVFVSCSVIEQRQRAVLPMFSGDFGSSEIDNTTHDVRNITTFQNTSRWQQAWSEAMPHTIAKTFVDRTDKPLFLEIKFRFQMYKPHTLPCAGGDKCLQNIKNSLYDQKVKTWQDKNFIPDGFLKHLFTVDVIKHLLEPFLAQYPELAHSMKPDFIKRVYLSGVKILAICINASLDLKRFCQLMKLSVSAPRIDAQGNKTSRIDSHEIGDVDLPLHDEENNFPAAWERDQCERFMFFQSMYCAHIFPSHRPYDEVEKPEKIEDSIIMPFLNREKLGDGGYGTVYSVDIHNCHHEFGDDRSQKFALKIFSSGFVSNWQEETHICQVLAASPHEHITPFLTAWADDHNLNILFPKADSDLEQFLLDKCHKPASKSAVIVWMLQQMLGLIEGLASIHRLAPSRTNWTTGSQRRRNRNSGSKQEIMCHHDLKPRNILLFGSTMKIGDFGLARLTERTSRGLHNRDSPQSAFNKGDLEYIAPEKWLRYLSSRSCDIWSMGCIFLEILLWFFESPNDDIKRFRTEREQEITTFETREETFASFWCQGEFKDNQWVSTSEPILKKSVRTRLEWLKQQAKDKGVLKDLVRLVELDMMVTDMDKRRNVSVICDDLKNLLLRARSGMEKSDDYFDKPQDGPIKAPASALSVIDQRSERDDDTQMEPALRPENGIEVEHDQSVEDIRNYHGAIIGTGGIFDEAR